MAGGLFALLDDVAAIAKLSAASLDDVAAQTVKVSAKAAGIVIDDTAVTPRYVTGLAAERELSVIWRIAMGSLRNKLLILLPGALLLSVLLPGAITPILMLGGAYLCFEGAEKVLHLLLPHEAAHEEAESAPDAQALEDGKVAGAIRTDLILSAEITAVSLAAIEVESLVLRGAILALVGLGITVAVYGVVALIVKADDVGVALVRRGGPVSEPVGRGLVRLMPGLLAALSLLGTLAMLWVGGGILLHGAAEFGLHRPEEAVEKVGEIVSGPFGQSPALAWLGRAVASGVLGLLVGGGVAAVVTLGRRLIR
jgi:uncharacterized protein